MSRSALEALELPALLEVVGRYVVSPLGEWRLDVLRENPLHENRSEAETSLMETGEAMEVCARAQGADDDKRTLPPRFQGLRDLRTAIDKLGVDGSVLEAIEIYHLLELLGLEVEVAAHLPAVAGGHFEALQ